MTYEKLRLAQDLCRHAIPAATLPGMVLENPQFDLSLDEAGTLGNPVDFREFCSISW